MRDFKFIEENGRWVIPEFEDYNKYQRISGNIYSLTLKKLGKTMSIRSDKVFCILEEMGAKKIWYTGKVRAKVSGDSFYAPTKEIADKIEAWINDTILKQEIEKKLFS